MISAVCERFDVAVKHRAGATAAHRMPGAMHVQPLGGRFLATADLIAHGRIENLGASTGNRTKSSVAKNLQRIAKRHFENSIGQMPGFDGGERLNMKMRIEGPYSLQQIEIH